VIINPTIVENIKEKKIPIMLLQLGQRFVKVWAKNEARESHFMLREYERV